MLLHVAGSLDKGAFLEDYDYMACNVTSGPVSFNVRPISFSIPKEVLSDRALGPKSRNFASIIPGRLKTYTYDNQQAYYEGYHISWFGITTKKSGWDCLRHLEIVASGCMPYFVNADMIPEGTMFHWPKSLLTSVLHLQGIDHVSVRGMSVDGGDVLDDSLINKEEFDTANYKTLLSNIQDHVRRQLTTEAMAEYVLSTRDVDMKAVNILFVGSPNDRYHYADYSACTLFHGMRSLLGSRVVDFPKRDWMYAGFPIEQAYGRGYSYAGLLQDIVVDRTRIEDRLRQGEFSHVVFAVTHHGRHPLIDIVRDTFVQQRVIFVDGSDTGTDQSHESNKVFQEVCHSVGVCYRRELNCSSPLHKLDTNVNDYHD